MPTAFSASGSGLPACCVEIGEHSLEAALHVEAVVAVADRLVERGQFVGMVDDAARHGLDQVARRAPRRSLQYRASMAASSAPIRLPAASK